MCNAMFVWNVSIPSVKVDVSSIYDHYCGDSEEVSCIVQQITWTSVSVQYQCKSHVLICSIAPSL